ncbi:ABC transporter permease [Streptococcus sciuri]|uniref:ABC transporter permease n=1 Tax=Streptococcus sciuri TaxID=2973939 RepID=A0ABT2F5Z9_9STRE|nr:ABC transporter permease [Streptococcus sciuri]MCS4487898.1 ABC transporter permease [Streptococcus sciuri]
MNYLKADLYRILKERKLVLSLAILLGLTLLAALLLSSVPSSEETLTLIQLLTQFLPLFFLVPTNLLFGEDFHHRTINNLIVKRQERKSIFLYKILANLILNLLYISLAYGLSCAFRLILGGAVNFADVWSIFIHQVPLYTCIILLASIIFITLPKINQAYLSFILIALLFDNVLHLISENLLHLPLPKNIYLFLTLQNTESTWNGSTLIACLFSLIYLGASYYLFQKKELK